MAPSAIVLSNVTVDYVRKNRLGMAPRRVRALDGVSLEIPARAVIGVAGISGSGKSTLARCAARWLQPVAGEVTGSVNVQLVMQDPGASLNPRFSAFEIVEEPLRIAGRSSMASYTAARVEALLARVGVPDRTRRAGEFSGGERARLAIARALAALPESAGGFLILDESLSSLDRETRVRILEMLFEFRADRGLGYVFVSHDLDLLAGIVNELVIVHHGRIVDQGPPDEVIRQPRHEQTVRLVDAMLTRSR
jgi:ABC-type glutathione transport system ATPase component